MDITVLLVEDSNIQLRALQSELKEIGWNVIYAQDIDGALYQVGKVAKEKKHIDVAMIDLGIPPVLEDPIRGGIALIKKLREKPEAQSVKILAYTSAGPKEFDYSLVLRKLLTLQASFVALRGEQVDLPSLLKFVWLGYVFISPTPSLFLPKSIADKPDPLDSKQWETLKFIDQDKSLTEIANEVGLTVEGIRARLPRIRDILIETDEIGPDAETDDLIRWYRTMRTRYSRD
ncbi:MAG: response regulator transcription factor [Anaerolineales bacterium]|nr:response regulator transcription factor [Anaerolineales bacterium]